MGCAASFSAQQTPLRLLDRRFREHADQFDMRWGILGRVRLLRGAVLEKLGRPDDAREQYKLALAQWTQADPDLQVFVQEAQQKLAQLQERS